MILDRFSVTGEEVVDENGVPNSDGDLPVIRPADPRRSIRRYELGMSLGVTVRLNLELLAAARNLPIVVCRLSPPVEFPPEDRMSREDRSREGDWIKTGLSFFWDLPDALAAAGCSACYLADRFGPSAKRVYYFVAEQPTEFRAVAEREARAKEFEFAAFEADLRDVAPDFLPIEVVGELKLDRVSPPRIEAGFSFTGHESSLERLRSRLESSGYAFDEAKPYLSELRMRKLVPVDPDGFLDELRKVVPLARDMGCSYRGEETVDGGGQFLLTVALPEKYRGPKTSFFSRMLGR